MKTIIAGSRTIVGYSTVKKAIERSGFVISVVFSGAARGVDKLGEKWAKENGVPVECFPANWKEYGKGAGMIRNSEMVAGADALIAVWDGISRGTADTIGKAKKSGLKVFVYKGR